MKRMQWLLPVVTLCLMLCLLPMTQANADGAEHTHVYDVLVTAPTCVEQGYTTYSCACGESYVSDYVETIDHDEEIIEVYVGMAPGCDWDGNAIEYYQCRICSAKREQYVSLPALGHSYELVIQEATCTEPGFTAYVCWCGDVDYIVEEVEALGHSSSGVGIPVSPTCTMPGYVRYNCEVCHESFKGEILDALGHNYELIDESAPTCLNSGKKTYRCLNCHNTYAEWNDPLPHIPGEWFQIEQTCTQAGVTGYFCINCGYQHVENYEPALGHNCDEHNICIRCGKLSLNVDALMLDEQGNYTTRDGKQVYIALGVPSQYSNIALTELVVSWGEDAEHLLGMTYWPQLLATMDVDGYAPLTEESLMWIRDVLLGGEYGPSILENDLDLFFALEPCEHDYVGVVTEATCVAQGYTTYVCSLCSDSYRADFVEVTEHTWNEPGCNQVRECTVCGKTDGIVEHLWREEGVCDVCCLIREGYTADVLPEELVLSDDGRYSMPTGEQVYIDVNKLVGTLHSIAGRKLARSGDNDYWELLLSVTNAEGYAPLTEKTRFWVISLFSESSVNEQNMADYLVYQVMAGYQHSFETTVHPATCTEGGYTTYFCSCGESYIADEIGALGHKEVIDAAVVPNCITTGLTEGKHCSVCEAILVEQEEVPATGSHIYGDFTIVKEATTTEPGLKEKVCSNCGDKISEEIPVIDDNVPPTDDNARNFVLIAVMMFLGVYATMIINKKHF